MYFHKEKAKAKIIFIDTKHNKVIFIDTFRRIFNQHIDALRGGGRLERKDDADKHFTFEHTTAYTQKDTAWNDKVWYEAHGSEKGTPALFYCNGRWRLGVSNGHKLTRSKRA